MTTKKQNQLDIEYSESLKIVMETYQEIAASRMQHVRTSVISSRDFLLSINIVFQQVKSSYKTNNLPAGRQGLPKKNFIKYNGKTIFILISANTGLYGDIIARTFDLFAKEIRKEQGDIAIIGRVGLKQFQEAFPKRNFMYFELSDDKIDLETLKKIIPHLIQYEKVLVFYQQFQNIISSQPIITSVSGDILPMDKIDSGIKYVFEPSLDKVMEFFEQQISGSIFEQTVYESQLAKFSSRMVALDKATENIQKNLKQIMLQKERIKHQAINKEQNQRLASMRLWTTK
ncbi:MAG: hypothetical protein A3B41_02015 [Candidatus Levybacteria bacterium RIFCSPLOWO2_01_FULL_37_26]|nr:MAG: hypothetical protein A3B41_02015 [Candidatus Levybacteria bacterium RIFCSPLOWO2_01_FULL_37_26]